MHKIKKISFISPDKLICIFSNEEERILDLGLSLDDQFARKILNDEHIFRQARVGELGQIYWENVGEIIDCNGKVLPCQYDISPEFAYINSRTTCLKGKNEWLIKSNKY